jgi:hypothetical protein
MTDIRAWLRENRPDLGVQPRGAIKKAAQEVYYEANGQPAPGDVSRETPEAGTGPDGDELAGPDDVSRETTGEVAPEAPAGSLPWLGRGGAPKSPRDRKVSHRRVPVDGLFSMVWAALGKLATNPQTLPVGRVMTLQAPAAGMVLDDALRGSVVDRMAQPLARGQKRLEVLFSVAGPPLLVGAVCQKPELYPVIRPMLVEALKGWLVLSGPKIRKAQERERKLLAELDGLDVSTIEEMIDALFAPPDQQEQVIPGGHPAGSAA